MFSAFPRSEAVMPAAEKVTTKAGSPTATTSSTGYQRAPSWFSTEIGSSGMYVYFPVWKAILGRKVSRKLLVLDVEDPWCPSFRKSIRPI